MHGDPLQPTDYVYLIWFITWLCGWYQQSVDGVYVCVAFSSEYKIINMDSGHVQDLFLFDSGQVVPTITKISRVSCVSELLNILNKLRNSPVAMTATGQLRDGIQCC